jgi:2-dehydropantoate 2-reductase
LISLQNGVDNVERVRSATGLDPIAAVVYVASSMPTPGRIKHVGRGDLVIGDFPGRSSPSRDAAIARVANWFETAGVPCRVSPHIDADLWTKLIVNAGLNAISAVVQVPYGDVVATPDSRETVRRLVSECVAVARADGVSMPDVDFVEMVLRFAHDNGHVYSSTAQDLARGTRTEIDALNGLVVRRGVSRGVPTPVNQTLVGLVKLREAQFQRTTSPSKR